MRLVNRRWVCFTCGYTILAKNLKKAISMPKKREVGLATLAA